MYAAAGVFGAIAGSSIGKSFDGQRLLFLFALVMILIGVLISTNAKTLASLASNARSRSAQCTWLWTRDRPLLRFLRHWRRLFGRAGPRGSTGMPMLNAVGTSLVAVTAFGVTTAVNYSVSGLVNWPLAFAFIGGGMLGSIFGAKIAKRLSGTTGRLTTVFAAIVFVVASYMLINTVERI